MWAATGVRVPLYKRSKDANPEPPSTYTPCEGEGV